MTDYIFNINDLSKEEYDFYYLSMSQTRKNKVDRKKNIKDKIRTVAGEMLVKKHFGEDAIIEELPGKKPFIKNKNGEFSISHSDSYVVLLVGDTPVGIDIEKIRDVNLHVAKKVCNEKELCYIFGKNPEDEDYENKDEAVIIRFFEMWTFKEAFVKYSDAGFSNLKKADYFDEGIRKTKKINGEYIIHMVY